MIFVPLPLVVALLLVVAFVLLLRNQAAAGGNKPFLALIALCAFQSVIVGLRWGYDITELRYLMPIGAACVPPLVFESFRRLVHREDGENRLTLLAHAAPAVVVILLLLASLAGVPLPSNTIDIALIVIFIGYALAILNLGRRGPDGLDDARLDSAVPAFWALVLAAASLCISALFDLAILLNFERAIGLNMALVISGANLLGLLLLGLTAVVASRAQPRHEVSNENIHAVPTAAQDREVLATVDRLLLDQKLFRDDNLTLTRLSRRASLPARQISGAINRQAGKNVSQYINEIRISEACRLLRETDMSVTAAMFEAGFQTKSNFNREFRRVTSLSPLAWREKNRLTQDNNAEAGQNSPQQSAVV